jgi:hypothetical protein
MTPPDRRPTSAADARAEVEARRAAVRAEREAAFEGAWGGRIPGRAERIVSWAGTVALAVSAIAAVVDPDSLLVPFVVVSLLLFCAGALVVALDVVLAAARSRDDLIGIGGLFFVSGCAPREVQVSLNGSLAVAVVVAVAAPLVRLSAPELAFGTLAPLFQVAMTGLWSVRHGLFPARSPGTNR